MKPATFRMNYLSKKRTPQTKDITEADKLLARELWVQVEHNYADIGKFALKELFRRYPDHKSFFKDLDPDEEDEYLNSQFEKHMVKALLPNLGMVIRNLDRPEEMRSHMERLATVHMVRAVGIKKKHVEVLKQILMDTLKHQLGSAMTSDHEKALNKIFARALSIMANAIFEQNEILRQAKERINRPS